MACSSPSCNLFFNRPSTPIPTSATGCSLSYSNSIFRGYHAISRHCASSASRIRAKFEKFQSEPPQDSFREAETSSALENFEDDEEDDSCLPPDLEGAVRQSSQATALFVSSGGMRAIVCVQVDNLVADIYVYV